MLYDREQHLGADLNLNNNSRSMIEKNEPLTRKIAIKKLKTGVLNKLNRRINLEKELGKEYQQ